MRATTRLLALTLLAAIALAAPAPAMAGFGFKDYDFATTAADGGTAVQAGSHPAAVTTQVDFNTAIDPLLGEITEGQVKDVYVTLPPGLVGDPNAVPRCSNSDFLAMPGGEPSSGGVSTLRYTTCPDGAALGLASISIGYESSGRFYSPIYNLDPSPGEVERLGFVALGGVPVTIDLRISEARPYPVIASVTSASQVARVYGSKLTLWGDPTSPVHDRERGACVAPEGLESNPDEFSRGACPVDRSEKPLVTLPRSCGGPLLTTIEADSWQEPGTRVKAPVEAPAMSGCAALGFAPSATARPTSNAAESPAGFDFGLAMKDEGIGSLGGNAASDIRRTEVTLPEGFTTNPSIAEGLRACTTAELARETASSAPGEGCPRESKIGSVEVETPLLDEALGGSVYVAKPYENEAGNSLLGLYMVIKSAKLGIAIKQPIEIEADPVSGRLRAIADEIPQFPLSHIELHFREGPRAPLTTPAGCGSYAVDATLTPWSGGPPVPANSLFDITTGPQGGACPPGGGGPFTPGFEAGTVTPIAGSYSPFVLKLRRDNGSPQLRSIDTTLPTGLLGKLAGVAECSDSQIATAAGRSGPLQGALELASASCPAASEVGLVHVGAGSGSPAYVTGRAYLAGPYHGAPLSLAVITPAVSGPFDLGDVVVRVALHIDGTTSQIHAVSDPLPSILAGIPLDVRSVELEMNRPQFTLNPTGCEPKQILGTATSTLGQVASLAERFQVGACGSLPYAPKLFARLFGATNRGAHPRLQVVFKARPGEANTARIAFALPHSEFIDQAHFRTICTRVQFAAGQCPAGSVYGQMKAITPLLDYPLEGPVYLRSSTHQLPDVVAALHGPPSQPVEFDLEGRVDSIRGGVRTTFDSVPDAPVSTAIVTLRGGSKGLFQNSTDVCRGVHRATLELDGQNGKTYDSRPVLQASCHS